MHAKTQAITYVACFTQVDGVYSCGHVHPTIRDAMNCLVPDGGSFIRAHEAGTYRSLTNPEFIDYLETLEQMPWSWRRKVKEAPTPFPPRREPNKEPVGARE